MNIQRSAITIIRVNSARRRKGAETQRGLILAMNRALKTAGGD